MTTTTAGSNVGALVKVEMARKTFMQATRLEKATAEYVDDFAPWCLAGLVLLALHALLQLWLRYTPW